MAAARLADSIASRGVEDEGREMGRVVVIVENEEWWGDGR